MNKQCQLEAHDVNVTSSFCSTGAEKKVWWPWRQRATQGMCGSMEVDENGPGVGAKNIQTNTNVPLGGKEQQKHVTGATSSSAAVKQHLTVKQITPPTAYQQLQILAQRKWTECTQVQICLVSEHFVESPILYSLYFSLS